MTYIIDYFVFFTIICFLFKIMIVYRGY